MNNNSSTITSQSSFLEDVRKSRQARQKAKKEKSLNKLAEFMNANVSDPDMGVVPEEYAGIAYFTFFIFIPEILGLLFTFFYLSDSSIERFTSLDIDYFLTWIIGYEVVAALVLLYIANKAIKYVTSKDT